MVGLNRIGPRATRLFGGILLLRQREKWLTFIDRFNNWLITAKLRSRNYSDHDLGCGCVRGGYKIQRECQQDAVDNITHG